MAATAVSSKTVIEWLKNCAAIFQQRKDELTHLDAAIGDADHGANMARGFTAVETKLPSLEGKDIGTIFKTTAMTLISTVGGASGPLYGTFFLQAAAPANGKMDLSAAELASAFDAGLKGLMSRGKAAVGEKTMIDALVPGIAALNAHSGEGLGIALEQAVAAARKGRDSTIPLVATKGRASYLGERSVGHVDPGATSSVLLLEMLQQAVSSPA